jgi:hypothetical protein
MKLLYKKIYWGIAILVIGMILACSPTEPASTFVLAEAPEIEPGVTLYYEGDSQVELISSQGQRVLIDVSHPNLLSTPPSAEDILLTTSPDPGHFDEGFKNEFKGKQLFAATGVLEQKNVVIHGIQAVENENQSGLYLGRTWNGIIFLIEMDNLHIAHLGDMDQAQLTADQMMILNQVDAAIVPFIYMNSSDKWRMMNEMKLITQINPHLIIPTHASQAGWNYALQMAGWQVNYNSSDVMTLRPSKLNGGTTLVFFPKTVSDVKPSP